MIDPLSQAATFTCDATGSPNFLMVGVVDEEEDCPACGNSAPAAQPRPLRLCEVAVGKERQGVADFTPPFTERFTTNRQRVPMVSPWMFQSVARSRHGTGIGPALVEKLYSCRVTSAQGRGAS